MGDNTISGIKSSSQDNAALTVGGAKATYLPLSGGRAMGGNLDMGNNFITNVKDLRPASSQYAATVNFVNTTVTKNNETISKLIDSMINEVEDLNNKGNNEENVFSFVMDDDLFKEDGSDITKV